VSVSSSKSTGFSKKSNLPTLDSFDSGNNQDGRVRVRY
jgi:hypothetical protein